MSHAQGFFIIELLITIVLVTWFMGMILRHNVNCIAQQTAALNSLNAMNRALTILESPLNTSLKHSVIFHNTIKLTLDVYPIPQFFMFDNPPSLNLSCLESIAIAHITASHASAKSPLWCLGGVIAGK